MPTRGYGPDPFRKDESEGLFLRKTVIWVGGVLVLIATTFIALSWYQRHVFETAAETATKAANSVRKSFEEMDARTRARTERANAERAEAQRREREAEANRIAALNAEAARREASWAKFFTPSALCRDPGNRAMMECVNEHIRFKREFDRRWAAGEFR